MSSIEASENSMFSIGPEYPARGPGSDSRRGDRARRNPDLPAESFDFDKCEVVSETALRLALISRSEAALVYIADVLGDLADNAEVCAHLIHALARDPAVITSLVEFKRRCLLTNRYTHSYFLKAEFLGG